MKRSREKIAVLACMIALTSVVGISYGQWNRTAPRVYLATTTDSVGIGTQTPSPYRLNVVGNTYSNKFFLPDAGTIFSTGSQSGMLVRTAGNLDFYNGSSVKMSIMTSGNVGIGTNPFSLLTLKGGNYLSWEYNSNAASRRWWIHNDEKAWGDFAIMTESSKGLSVPDLTRFYIDPNGNVGIGLFTSIIPDVQIYDSPRTFRFQNSSADDNEGFQFYSSNHSSGLLTILNNGKIGIGTTSPSAYGGSAMGPLVNIYNSGTGATTLPELYLGNAATVSGQIVGTVGFNAGASGSEKRLAFIRGLTATTQTTVPYGSLAFYTANGAAPLEKMRIDNSGNVLIGTTNNPNSYKLAVNGKIGCKEVIVTQTGWSDFVFKDDYKLKPLNQVADYVKKNKHLEGIPTEAEVKKNGVSVGEMQARLLQKVEELTLHMIEMKKENDELRTKVSELERKMER